MIYHKLIIVHCYKSWLKVHWKWQPRSKPGRLTRRICEIIIFTAESPLEGGASRSHVIIPKPKLSFLLACTLCRSGMSKEWPLKRINIFELTGHVRNSAIQWWSISVPTKKYWGKIHSASACINTIIKSLIILIKNVCFNIATRAQDVIQNNSHGPLSKHLSSYSLNLCSRL